MKVRFLGISLETNSSVTIAELISDLIVRKTQLYKLGEHNRLIFINENHNKEYHLGVLITIKDQRRFCELANIKGDFKIKVNDLEEHHNLMDFNFFVINKKSGLGLYQHYHQSCSANFFCYFLSRQHIALRESKISSEINDIDDISKKEKKAIRKKYAGKFNWQILVRKENLKKILNKFRKIKSFQFDFVSLNAQEREYLPLSKYVNKENKKLSFMNGSPVHRLSSGIVKTINDMGLTAGSVAGIDGDGIERVIRILDNPDNFGEYEYDDVASKLNSLNLNKFESCWVIKELLSKCKQNKHIFEAKVK